MSSNRNRIFRILSFTFSVFNGLAGILGFYSVCIGDFVWPLKLIIIGAGFDFLDGYFAKKTLQYSPIGAYADCIADSITYVLLPTFILLALDQYTQRGSTWISILIFLIGLLFLFCGIYRLIRFLKYPTGHYFEGLPTVVAALFVGVLNVLINISPVGFVFLFSIGIPFILFIFCISFLMITHLKYPSHISYSPFFKILRVIVYSIIGLFLLVSNFWTTLAVFLTFLVYTLAGPYYMRKTQLHP